MDTIAIILAAVAFLYLTALAVHAHISDTSPLKNPLRTRAEKKRAWREADDYGRRYGSR